MAAFFPRLIFPDERRVLLARAVNWVPGTISIAVAVSVALAIGMARMRPAAMTALALVFEVVGSYGIAAAEFLQPAGLEAGSPWVGLSWVAVFMLMFNVVMPAAPRHAVSAALASVTSVPAMVMLSISFVFARIAAGRFGDLFQVRLSVLARRDHGVCRRPGGLQLRDRSDPCS
jgi:hypothetical protein